MINNKQMQRIVRDYINVNHDGNLSEFARAHDLHSTAVVRALRVNSNIPARIAEIFGFELQRNITYKYYRDEK